MIVKRGVFLACSVMLFLVLLPFVWGSSFKFESSSDRPEVNEQMGDVVSAITAVEMPDLKSFNMQTDKGKTKVNQYIRFGDASTTISSPITKYTKDDSGKVGAMLFIDGGSSSTSAFFEYELEFEQGLKSKISNGKLSDFPGVKLTLFMDEYTIVGASLPDNSNLLSLKLATGAVVEYVQEGEKKIYTLGEESYEVEVTHVDTDSAILKVNGQTLNEMSESSFVEFKPGFNIGVNAIVVSSGGTSDLVQLFVGARIIEFSDDFSDSSFDKGLKINQVSVPDGFVQAVGTKSGDTFSLSKLKYRGASSNELYITQGNSLKSQVSQDVLFGNWDVRFEGLSQESTTQLKIQATDNNNYKLTLKNSEGKTLSFPFVSNSPSFKLGDASSDLVIVEPSNTTHYNVDLNDYVVLTTSNTKNGKSYVVRYDGVDTSSKTLTFDDVSTGTKKSVTYANSTVNGTLGQADLSIGSITSRVYIDDDAGNRLAVDMDGDGDHDGTAMDFIGEHGYTIELGSTNSISSPYSLSVSTDGSDLEENTTTETVTFSISSGSTINLNDDSFSGVTLNTGTTSRTGMTQYGVLYTLTSIDTGSPEELTMDYPTRQLFATIYVDLFSTTSESVGSQSAGAVSTCANGVLDGDETGVDCGGSCPACVSEGVRLSELCSNGRLDGDETGVDCGGSCPACVMDGSCAQGCEYTGEDSVTVCLSVGESRGMIYCSADRSLKKMKNNGEVCSEVYECKIRVCESGRCGKKMSFSLVFVNSLVIVLLFLIIFYSSTIITV